VTAARAVQLAWTPLSRRLGVTRTAQQRKQILAALAAMNWSADIDPAVTGIRGEAARTIAAAIRRCDRLRLLGTASLPGGHQLVGIEHAIDAIIDTPDLCFDPAFDPAIRDRVITLLRGTREDLLGGHQASHGDRVDPTLADIVVQVAVAGEVIY
jgi:hypothetical protein